MWRSSLEAFASCDDGYVGETQPLVSGNTNVGSEYEQCDQYMINMSRMLGWALDLFYIGHLIVLSLILPNYNGICPDSMSYLAIFMQLHHLCSICRSATRIARYDVPQYHIRLFDSIPVWDGVLLIVKWVSLSVLVILGLSVLSNDPIATNACLDSKLPICLAAFPLTLLLSFLILLITYMCRACDACCQEDD